MRGQGNKNGSKRRGGKDRTNQNSGRKSKAQDGRKGHDTNRKGGKKGR